MTVDDFKGLDGRLKFVVSSILLRRETTSGEWLQRAREAILHDLGLIKDRTNISGLITRSDEWASARRFIDALLDGSPRYTERLAADHLVGNFSEVEYKKGFDIIG